MIRGCGKKKIVLLCALAENQGAATFELIEHKAPPPQAPLVAMSLPAPDAFIAGCISGCAGTIVGQPFDTSKVMQQVGVDVKVKNKLSHVVGLYRGIGPPLVTSGFVRALNFGLWQTFRDGLNEKRILPYTWMNCFVAGCGASMITAPLTQVVHVLKLQKQVHKGARARRYWSFLNTNLWKPGFFLHTGLEALGSGVYYTTYIKSKEHLSRRFDSEESNLVVRLLSGSTAGVAGWTCIYPLDTLRSRVLSAKRGSSTTAGSVARDIFQQNGIAGFYRGLMPCLLRAIPVAATVLPTYDYVLDFLRE